MDIAGLLDVRFEEITLLDQVAKDDASALAPFTENPTQLSVWVEGFKKILSDRQLASDTLAKQVYFPVNESEYHLLAPLYASSLSHALYGQVEEARFGENAKAARECRKKEDSKTVIVNYPDLAIQKFGGTKPQNVSRLNSLRRASPIF